MRDYIQCRSEEVERTVTSCRDSSYDFIGFLLYRGAKARLDYTYQGRIRSKGVESIDTRNLKEKQ